MSFDLPFSALAAYLKEEVFQEQLVRSVVPFRKFLPIAAQMNGKIINYNAIAKDLGIDWSTVKTYYEILEDTWLGISLPAFHKSLRKQQLKGNKFYLFDIGVHRTLERSIKRGSKRSPPASSPYQSRLSRVRSSLSFSGKASAPR